MSATKPKPADLIPIYKATRAQYAAQGLTEKVAIQDRLIARLRRRAELQKG